MKLLGKLRLNRDGTIKTTATGTEEPYGASKFGQTGNQNQCHVLKEYYHSTFLYRDLVMNLNNELLTRKGNARIDSRIRIV